MMTSTVGAVILLLLVTALSCVNARPEGVGNIKLAGIMTGTIIKFEYFGKYFGFGTVVFSMKDKYGSGLQIQLNHRTSSCEFKFPKTISFNTVTNGRLGTSEDVEVNMIETTYWNGNFPFATTDAMIGWEVTAEEDGFNIIQKDYFDRTDTPIVSHFFKYRSPHQLSDITEVKVEETKVCQSGRWHAFINFEQKVIPDFKTLKFEGTDAVQDSWCNPHRASFGSVDFYSTRIILYAFNKQSRMSAKLRAPSIPVDLEICAGNTYISSKTKMGVTIQHISNVTYEITLSANGSPLNTCEFQFPLTDLEKNHAFLKTYYNKITHLEMQ